MKNKFYIIILSIILAGIYWQWWIPGPRVASDFSLLSQDLLKSLAAFPQTWSVGGTEGLGEYASFTLWSWPFNLLLGLLANLNFSFVILERLSIIIPFLFLGSYGIWKLFEYFELSVYARLISILFYLANSYIILVIDGGQLSISLAYALFPLGFLSLEYGIRGNLRKKILSALVISLIGFFDIRFIYVFLLLCFIKFLYEFLFLRLNAWLPWIRSWLKSGLIITAIVLGLNAYWIIIILKFPLSDNFYSYLTESSSTSFISLSHSLLFLSPHWFKNVFGNITQLRFEFILIPILVFLAPLFRPRNRLVGFWLVIALISIFLTKGSSEPFGEFYSWLYSKLLGFSLFRDSSKFFFLTALSYTILIGITVDEIIKKINTSSIRNLFLVILTTYLIFLVSPVWLGKMTGTFSTPSLQKEYEQLNKLILKDNKESNIFWIPTIYPLTSLNNLHPSVEAARLAQKRPFAQAIKGSYETFNFLREANYMGQLFDIANIGYVVYPQLNPKRDNLNSDNIKYYYTFLNQLSHLDWLSRIDSSKVPLLRVKSYQNKFFVTPNTWVVFGSDKIYTESTKSANLALSKNALVFAEEFSSFGKEIDKLPQAKIVLFHKNILDLAASFVENKDLIFPAKFLNHDPDVSRWWKRDTSDFRNWKDFLDDKYGINNQDFDLKGGWAISEGNLELKVESQQITKGKILLARVMESSKSGQVNFYQNNKLIGGITTQKKDDNVRWFEVGILNGDSQINIKTVGSINVINALAVLSLSEWQLYKQKALIYKDKITDFEDAGDAKDDIADVHITYQQINPTKYKVSIKNLKKNATLVFAQYFDDNWRLNSKSPFSVYSLLNGFELDKDGIYELVFTPQEYIPIGLIISAATLLLSIVLLFV
ncbi:hypothetical protein HYW41_02215 [Candidatus Daviesbacteria bacterium]|nr:hypothetical protein [Candidatus Daviesbacteria bacterium]